MNIYHLLRTNPVTLSYLFVWSFYIMLFIGVERFMT